MSLITCPECGNKVSDKAKSCPNCGMPGTQFKVEKTDRFQETNDDKKIDNNKDNSFYANNLIIGLVGVSIFIVLLGLCTKGNSDSDKKSERSSYTISSYGSTDSYSSTSGYSSTSSKGEDITISTGTYVVGEDIVPGKYDVDYVSGRYALFEVKQSKDSPGAVTAMVMGDRTCGDDVQHYSNLSLSRGNVVIIENGNLTVNLTAK